MIDGEFFETLFFTLNANSAENFDNQPTVNGAPFCFVARRCFLLCGPIDSHPNREGNRRDVAASHLRPRFPARARTCLTLIIFPCPQRAALAFSMAVRFLLRSRSTLKISSIEKSGLIPQKSQGRRLNSVRYRCTVRAEETPHRFIKSFC